jgi:hypothetical protein
MQSNYFPGFNFTVPFYKEEPGLEAFLVPVEVTPEEVAREGSLDLKVIEICVDDDPGITGDPRDIDVRIDYDLVPEFRELLAKVSCATSHRFEMDRRELFLVSQKDLEPKTLEEENRLVDKYGEYMRKGGGGDCTRRSDGIFLLRVGMEPDEISTRSAVIEIAAHEYGHTLGKGYLSIQVFEELKAYAFASLCERVDLETDNTSFADPRSDLHSDRVHDLAIHRLGELLRSGVPELAILSHLVGESVGGYNPKSYLNFL